MATPIIPGSVAPGELIESSWGNDVNAELSRQETDHTAATTAALGLARAQQPQTTILAQSGAFPLTAASWADVQLGTFSLTYTCDILVIVMASLYAGGSGGRCELTSAIGGTQAPTPSPHGATILGNMNAFLTHQRTTTLGPGTYMLSAQGWSSVGGNIDRISGSVTTLRTY
jgi:hypothetical protein